MPDPRIGANRTYAALRSCCCYSNLVSAGCDDCRNRCRERRHHRPQVTNVRREVGPKVATPKVVGKVDAVRGGEVSREPSDKERGDDCSGRLNGRPLPMLMIQM
ncbi:MAG: hypothetical protein NVS3B5_05120 [Sphingomicrobium sp.]